MWGRRCGSGGGERCLGEDYELFGVALHLLRGDDEAEVVQEEELQFELVELGLREATDLEWSRHSFSVQNEATEWEIDRREAGWEKGPTFAYRELV